MPMTILFTPEDLIQYLYQETSPQKTAAIEAALMDDWTLREKLEVIKTSTQCLDMVQESPRTEVILEVLRYAREAAAETVQH